MAVPNGHYALLWNHIIVKPEDEAWDTKVANSNPEQIGHILETWLTFLFMAKGTTSIRMLLNAVIHIDGKLNDRSFIHKPRPIDRQYPPHMLWNIKHARKPPTA